MKSDFYTHPAFTDVMFFLRKALYTKEKELWELEITWWNIRGWKLGEETLHVTESKLREFRRVE